ncbi:putative Histidine ammonia-lyase [Candidatus Sulfopaludibacter sp. SbA4]|nr:putative Histidine ammonia-lyase [Candidatus Sulfopaludibacter sp. SbA4]
MTVVLGEHPLTIEDVVRVTRENAAIFITEDARTRIAKGRSRLDELLARGDRIYGVNTGVGGNVGISLAPDQMELMQHNLVRHLSCATGAPLPNDVVRAATLLRVATFLPGTSAVRHELVDALVDLLNYDVTPVVPRYGSVGASGDLMPSAYIGRVLVGMGEAEFQGRRLPAGEALKAAGLSPIRFAPKESLALMNGTTVMTAVAALAWVDAFRVLRAMLSAVALSIEAMQAPDLPFHPWVHERKGHPGQIAVAAYLMQMLESSAYTQPSSGQTCYSLRCAPQGLGQVWEALEDSRAIIEREINSANDNPLIDPETGTLYKAGNFYGGHIARLLDTWKIDFASIANWGNALMALLVDDRFSAGLPANLTPQPGVNCGFKGMQLSVTSLACAVRQMAGPSTIHSLPTEQYNQDVVSLGMHAAVTAMDALECVRHETAMLLLASTQAVDLRGGPSKLGRGSRRIYEGVRQVARFQDVDRPMEREVAAVTAKILAGEM